MRFPVDVQSIYCVRADRVDRMRTASCLGLLFYIWWLSEVGSPNRHVRRCELSGPCALRDFLVAHHTFMTCLSLRPTYGWLDTAARDFDTCKSYCCRTARGFPIPDLSLIWMGCLSPHRRALPSTIHLSGAILLLSVVRAPALSSSDESSPLLNSTPFARSFSLRNLHIPFSLRWQRV